MQVIGNISEMKCKQVNGNRHALYVTCSEDIATKNKRNLNMLVEWKRHVFENSYESI